MPLLRNDASPPQYCPPNAPGGEMVPDNPSRPSKSWLHLVVRDPQFWVPVAVLAAGLFVLRWIS
jgi:hypothetical protein